MTSILIIRLSSIGDIFHTFTILPDIKKVYPESRIDWLVDERFKSVAELSPLIDNVISIPLRDWKKNKFTWFYKLINFKSSLPKYNYDYIIDTQGLIKSAFLSKFLFDGNIYGLDRVSARESLASLFYDHTYTVNQNDVAVIRLRGLIAKIFGLNSSLLSDFEFSVKQSNCGYISDNGYILYLHGTSKDNKKWPLDNWLTLTKWLINHSNKEIILTYSNKSEYEFAKSIIGIIQNERLKIIDKLSFEKLTDLVAKADLIIGVDTGLTHLANLLKKPSLAIYLHSNPLYVGMLESPIARNFGGYKQNVEPSQLINFIIENKLV